MLFSPPRYRRRPVVPVRLIIVVGYLSSITSLESKKQSGVRSCPGGRQAHLTGVTSVPSNFYSLSMNAEQ